MPNLKRNIIHFILFLFHLTIPNEAESFSSGNQPRERTEEHQQLAELRLRFHLAGSYSEPVHWKKKDTISMKLKKNCRQILFSYGSMNS